MESYACSQTSPLLDTFNRGAGGALLVEDLRN